MEIRDYIKNHPVPTDSLEVMDFLMDVEDVYDIVIDFKEVQKFNTPEQIITLIERKINDKR
jgi:acyl carrier protein